MNIQTKFNIGDTVWFWDGNTLRQDSVWKIIYFSKEIYYNFLNFQKREVDCYTTKEEAEIGYIKSKFPHLIKNQQIINV